MIQNINILEHYKNDYDYLDMNGITGDFSDENPYKGLNEFKLGFNPEAFELIGELDYIINEGVYTNIDINGILLKEFDRNNINKSAPKPKKIEYLKPEKEKEPKKSFITITK